MEQQPIATIEEALDIIYDKLLAIELGLRRLLAPILLLILSLI